MVRHLHSVPGDPLEEAVEIAAALPNDAACELIAGPIYEALSDRLIARMIEEEHPYGFQMKRVRQERPSLFEGLSEAVLEQVRRLTKRTRARG